MLYKHLGHKLAQDSSGAVGSLAMALFGIIAVYRLIDTHNLFFALLGLRDFLAAYFLLRREPAIEKGSARLAALAYASSALPLCYLSPSGQIAPHISVLADALFIVGFLLSTLAMIELGRLMGVTPANRGTLRTTGVYKLTKHPMYCGYTIAEAGWIILNPVNTMIFVVSLGAYLLRIRAENRILATGSIHKPSHFLR